MTAKGTRGLRAVWPVLAFAAVLAGCATVRPALQPRLGVAAAECAATPSMASPRAFARVKKDDPYSVTIRFDQSAPCVTDAAGRKGVYAVLDLPADESAGIITVTSFAMGEAIFSPRLELRDAQGALLREATRDAFLFSGAALQVQLRRRSGERFLVIASDAASVGQSVEQIQSQNSTMVVPAGPVYVPVTTGSEAKAKLVFAHNGEVTTTVAPMPKADK